MISALSGVKICLMTWLPSAKNLSVSTGTEFIFYAPGKDFTAGCHNYPNLARLERLYFNNRMGVLADAFYLFDFSSSMTNGIIWYRQQFFSATR